MDKRDLSATQRVKENMMRTSKYIVNEKSRDIKNYTPAVTVLGGYPTDTFHEDFAAVEYDAPPPARVVKKPQTGPGHEKIHIRTKGRIKGIRKKINASAIAPGNQIYFDNI